MVNGEALPRPLVGTALDRDPGKYVVRARIATGEPAEQTVELVTGETRTIHLVVAPPGQPLPPQPKDASAWTPAGWVTFSVGLVALAGMGIAIGVRQDALSSLQAQCDYQHVTCSTTLQPVVNRGIAASTVASALAIGGGLVAGAGLFMVVLGAVSTPRSERPVALHVSPFGVSLDGRFW
jgi:hypothetical protein